VQNTGCKYAVQKVRIILFALTFKPINYLADIFFLSSMRVTFVLNIRTCIFISVKFSSITFRNVVLKQNSVSLVDTDQTELRERHSSLGLRRIHTIR